MSRVEETSGRLRLRIRQRCLAFRADEDRVLGFVPTFANEMDARPTASLASANPTAVVTDDSDLRHHGLAVQDAIPVITGALLQVIANLQADPLDRVG